MYSLKINPFVLLILILILAFALRLPGVFWGVKISPKPNFVEYHPDESLYSSMSGKIISPTMEAVEDHIKGLPFQMFLISSIFKPVVPINKTTLTLIGRLLSVVYGVLTVSCVFFLSKEIFKDTYVGLFSSLLLAFTGLHVTQSHEAVPDVSTIFWWYATMTFSLLYNRYDKKTFSLLALFSAGMALAIKLSFLCLIPIVYVLIKKRLNYVYWMLALGVIFFIFEAAQGGHYNFNNFILTLNNVRNDNLNVINVENNKLWNPLIYLVGMPPALGLANFILLLTGIYFLKDRLNRKFLKKDYFFILILPLILQVVILCSMDITTSRHFLPLVPFLMMIAAYALNETRKRIKSLSFAILLTGVIFYQLAYVAGIEYYFVFDPRDNAAEWIVKNVPKGKSIHFTRYADMFDFWNRYRVVKDYNADYLLLHERYYAGYVRHKLFLIGKPYPYFKQIIHGNQMDFDEIQRIFKGESSFKLIKSFPMESITPENYLYKKFWGNYHSFIGDILIYQNTKPL